VTSFDGAGRRTKAFGVLTGMAAYRGFLGFYSSDNLTYAASIAYYALLSLFPFSMLALSMLGSATADDASRLALKDFFLNKLQRN
jgi:uncharacterized BrkB/YihY/UPF0761 family membrane protein